MAKSSQQLFPSRPKVVPQNKSFPHTQNTSISANKQIIKDKVQEKKNFFHTIKDMRQMIEQHVGSYAKDTLGMQKKNTKVPYTHLMGRRNKIIETHGQQKSRARQENIQYDSSMKLLNSNLVEKARQQKDEFDRNKYKYSGISEGRLGRQKDGMLTLSKKDLMRIDGKEPKSRAQLLREKEKEARRPSRIRKGNKNKKGSRKPRRH